ncbi:response regulator transcription factor [Pedobacter frigidisoli]|uniref:response regulator transcription factor n=1 Tax=Pedobacter frigidisoli TaxID=2530455 RepID=UPI00292D89FC|nr:response regulator [Pedobacter frigidisoli]
MAKIFVLEDNPAIREVVELILETANYTVTSFANVSDFMNREAKEVADLFILDVMLPDGSGIDVCKSIKSDCMLCNTPVIIMSANASIEQVKKGCVADGFIQKPFDIDFFLQKVWELISSSF